MPWTIKTIPTGSVYIETGEWSDFYVGDADTMTDEEWAEANLIAAAPALLEICKLSVHELISLGGDEEVIQNIYTVIAKAEGK